MTAHFSTAPQRVAVIGTGISGMSAAWLLSKTHDVTVYEKGHYAGGHTNTVDAETPEGPVPVDTGFIVYNRANYPNLTALFDHLGVATEETCMSFGASIEDGSIEYSGQGPAALFAKSTNAVRPRFWRMLMDLLRFYREAPAAAEAPGADAVTLGDFLEKRRYSKDFIYDHLLPMAAAIWSMPVVDVMSYPLVAFVRFYVNHGLLQVRDQPIWNTVTSGSRSYAEKLTAPYADKIRLNTAVQSIVRTSDGVTVQDAQGGVETFDHVVLASHADESLAMLSDADDAERALLSSFKYQRNVALLHTDEGLMPQSRRAWSSWNYLSSKSVDNREVCVTYWMNRLQNLDCQTQLFVTLNPFRAPRPGTLQREFIYDHPIFNLEAVNAQRELWRLQGVRRTWFCGAYFGHGFHEDGLQAGLAVAEALGRVKRPWSVENESGRIHLPSEEILQAAE